MRIVLVINGPMHLLQMNINVFIYSYLLEYVGTVHGALLHLYFSFIQLIYVHLQCVCFVLPDINVVPYYNLVYQCNSMLVCVWFMFGYGWLPPFTRILVQVIRPMM